MTERNRHGLRLVKTGEAPPQPTVPEAIEATAVFERHGVTPESMRDHYFALLELGCAPDGDAEQRLFARVRAIEGRRGGHIIG